MPGIKDASLAGTAPLAACCVVFLWGGCRSFFFDIHYSFSWFYAYGEASGFLVVVIAILVYYNILSFSFLSVYQKGFHSIGWTRISIVISGVIVAITTETSSVAAKVPAIPVVVVIIVVIPKFPVSGG